MSYKCNNIYSVNLIRMDIKAIFTIFFYFSIVNITRITFTYISISLGKIPRRKIEDQWIFKATQHVFANVIPEALSQFAFSPMVRSQYQQSSFSWALTML